jgi:hypothetical protein
MNVNLDVARRVSFFLCDRLNSIAGVKFFPETGNDQANFEPPYAVPVVTESTQVYPGAGVFKCQVELKFYTMADDTGSDSHSDLIRQMVQLIENAARQAPSFDPERELYVNGIVVWGTKPLVAEQAHGSVINLLVACQFPFYPFGK